MCLQASSKLRRDQPGGFWKRPLNGALCWPLSHCLCLKNNTMCRCTACLPHPSPRARQATSNPSERRVKVFKIKYASKGAKHQWQICLSSRREPLSANRLLACSKPAPASAGAGLQVHLSRDTSSAWHCQLRASEQLGEVENEPHFPGMLSSTLFSFTGG